MVEVNVCEELEGLFTAAEAICLPYEVSQLARLTSLYRATRLLNIPIAAGVIRAGLAGQSEARNTRGSLLRVWVKLGLAFASCTKKRQNGFMEISRSCRTHILHCDIFFMYLDRAYVYPPHPGISSARLPLPEVSCPQWRTGNRVADPAPDVLGNRMTCTGRLEAARNQSSKFPSFAASAELLRNHPRLPP
ncbi:hypothetical protein BaRGS_00028902, partial [Batillaria attramentaria]